MQIAVGFVMMFLVLYIIFGVFWAWIISALSVGGGVLIYQHVLTDNFKNKYFQFNN